MAIKIAAQKMEAWTTFDRVAGDLQIIMLRPTQKRTKTYINYTLTKSCTTLTRMDSYKYI